MPYRTAALIAHAATLHADLAALCVESRALIEHVYARRRASPFRVIRGGSDIALVTSTITDANLCLACIARKTGVPVGQVNSLLLVIARTIRLRIGPHRCGACFQHRGTFSVPTDGHPATRLLRQPPDF